MKRRAPHPSPAPAAAAALASLLLLLAACADPEPAIETVREPPAVPEENLVPVRQIETMPRTLLSEARVDVDGDGVAENVELWIDAARDERGRLMLDDGQRWLLAIREEERLIPLFDDFVQLSGLRFWIYEPDGGGLPYILLLRDQSAAYVLEAYRYDPEREGYQRAIAFSVVGNRLAGPGWEEPPPP